MALENWTKPTIARRNVMFSAIVIIGTIAVYSRVVAPHKNYLLAAQKNESAIGYLMKKNKDIGNKVALKWKKLGKLQEKLEKIHLKFFDSVEAKEFFSNIQAFVEESGCALSPLQFSHAYSTPSTQLPKIESNMTASLARLGVVGDYASIVKLTNKLQDSSKQVQIDSIRVKPIKGTHSESTGQLQCGVEITIYVMQKKREPLK